MSFKFDKSNNNVLVVCSVCGWRDLVLGGSAEATRSATQHRDRTHTGDRRMTQQLGARVRRAGQ